MNDMLEALKKAGVISENQHEAEEKRKREIRERRRKRRKENKRLARGTKVDPDRLQSCDTIAEFKDVTERLLMDSPGSPDLMEEIFSAAQRFEKKKGGSWLIWLLHQLKKDLPTIKSDKTNEFLKRVFRSPRSAVDIPKEWLK